MIRFAVALAFIGLNYFVYAYLGSREVIPARESFASFPLATDDWRCPRRETMDDAVYEVLGVTDYLLCDFQGPTLPVNVYIGYHESQVRRYDEAGDKVTSIHPPEHCLPGGGWNIIDSRIVAIESGGLVGEAKRFVIVKGESRNVVYFWYQSRGRIVARNHEVILYKFWDRATRGRSDGALVRFTAPIAKQDEAAADAAILDIASELTPHLDPYLPR